MYLQSWLSSRILPTVIVTFLAFFVTACAVPGSKLTQISIAGQLLSPVGEPLTEKSLEITLPANYGLNEIDLDYGPPEDYGHKAQRVRLKSDLMGTFHHTFQPVEYSRAIWILPPLGSFPKKPPDPFFFVRFLDDPNTYYSVLIKDDETMYTVYQESGGFSTKANTDKPAEIKAKLYKDRHIKSTGWIADITFQFLPSQSRGRFETENK